MNLGTFLWNISGIRAPKSYDTTPLLLEFPIGKGANSLGAIRAADLRKT
jgi:hypothetical protein